MSVRAWRPANGPGQQGHNRQRHWDRTYKHAEAFLELLYAGGQGRLGHIAKPRRARELPLPRECRQIPQMPNDHATRTPLRPPARRKSSVHGSHIGKPRDLHRRISA